jgi:uncharacterized membrane protein YsdA (DUF1294 family)
MVLDGDKRSASRSCHFIPGERAFSACLMGGLFGTRAGLVTFDEKNYLLLQPGILP